MSSREKLKRFAEYDESGELKRVNATEKLAGIIDDARKIFDLDIDETLKKEMAKLVRNKAGHSYRAIRAWGTRFKNYLDELNVFSDEIKLLLDANSSAVASRSELSRRLGDSLPVYFRIERDDKTISLYMTVPSMKERQQPLLEGCVREALEDSQVQERLDSWGNGGTEVTEMYRDGLFTVQFTRKTYHTLDHSAVSLKVLQNQVERAVKSKLLSAAMYGVVRSIKFYQERGVDIPIVRLSSKKPSPEEFNYRREEALTVIPYRGSGSVPYRTISSHLRDEFYGIANVQIRAVVDTLKRDGHIELENPDVRGPKATWVRVRD